MGKFVVDKKRLQLGMNPSTASHRLVKDLLFKYAVEESQLRCFHCGDWMSREDFSIEHMEPWLDSDDPVGLYFDLDNVTFSHIKCNSLAARRPHALNDEDRRAARLNNLRRYKAKTYTSEKRREQYLRTGK